MGDLIDSSRSVSDELAHHMQDCSKLPDDAVGYANQIGGHGIFGNKCGILYSRERDVVYKPVQKYPKGQHEVEFYKRIFITHCNDPVLVHLRRFIPTYCGLYRDPTDLNVFIGMKDLLAGLTKPSVCDLKMGQRTYTPDATAEKQKVEESKYKWQFELGFSISGIKIYPSFKDAPIYLDRTYGRSLDPTNVYDRGIRVFLGEHLIRSRLLARQFLHKLTDLLEWFETQRQLSFFASSLLLAYNLFESDEDGSNDGTAPPWNSDNGKPLDGTIDSVRVSMIDFTRWMPLDGFTRDSNFLHGLYNLIELFRQASVETGRLRVSPTLPTWSMDLIPSASV